MRLLYTILVAFPFVSGVSLQPPTNPHVGAITDINWINGARDPPTWGLFLMNISQAFDLKANFGVIDPKPQTVRVTLPSTLRPSNDYVLYAVNVSNWDQVLGSSGRFSISA
ncbi:hypothetical protein BDZ94DRAFT_1272650 [Collybia nuda]|uniref:Uncharacterized protein n=1 Tax=Collybia nuda TaxID=64659 RepID=A0A9P6C9X5_9AGAR|nr:hypothetical protein BDZ94DRAFT_1272650 [Collybia nuda]